MIWFTSDQHYGHENIIKYCNRPFGTVEEMNSQLMIRYNAMVKPEDIVYHLGDFSMHPRELVRLKDLNGQHHLIAGNHDQCHPVHKNYQKKTELYLKAGFRTVSLGETLPVDWLPKSIWLHHLPYVGDHHDSEERYNEFRPGNVGHWLLHGHVHTEWLVREHMINVGVDRSMYLPIALDDIKQMILSNPDKL